VSFWERVRQGTDLEIAIGNEGILRATPGIQPIGEAVKRGALSAWLPIEPNPRVLEAADINARLRDIALQEGKIQPDFFERAVKSPAARKSLRGLGRVASKWFGPIIGAYRLTTEVPKERGLGGKVSKGVRIIGEESFSTAAAFAGGAIGTAIAPGIGSIIGMGLGYVGGEVLGWAWNSRYC
jgi:hypothetical protein